LDRNRRIERASMRLRAFSWPDPARSIAKTG
jgi:hypothetical protein